MISPKLNSYIHHAGENGRCCFEEDSEAANAAYWALAREYEILVNNGELNLLFSLYEHDNKWVQIWAAAHPLEVDEARALAKLQQLLKAPEQFVSHSAKYTLQEWKLGELHFLPSRRSDQ